MKETVINSARAQRGQLRAVLQALPCAASYKSSVVRAELPE